MKSVADLRARLQELHRLTAQTPLFNPVFQLSLDVSRLIEAETVDLETVAGWIAELECEGLQSRAARLARLVAPVDAAANDAAFTALLDAGGDNFDAFAAHWARPFGHIVFTAHPTFLLNPAESAAVAEAASRGSTAADIVCVADHRRAPVTLDGEHADAMAALAEAQGARDAMTRSILAHGARRWPDRWRQLSPMPVRLASWVGYDMDGRTDISWSTSLRYRLEEKGARLAAYARDLAAIGLLPDLADELRAAGNHARAMAALFATDLASPAALSAAANRLSADDPAKLLSLGPAVARLEEAAAGANSGDAIALCTLAAAMRADGLGMGWIHFRVNASQLGNAIRRRIDPDNLIDIASNAALATIRTLLDTVQPLRSNLAALAIEDTTALRQFMAMAQILRHVDADAPIRLLIAECEEPQTVLAALYFARLFGIADRIDVSPLFETESAMEHGARFLDALLGEAHYRNYARARGRVAVQTGFSDAGRFVGQVPAALAIERLQGRLAETMARHGLTDVAALIFNTHGESMGRGAHPAGFANRMTWPMSEWARAQFARAGIALETEVSFQGGDGYLFFRTPALARATLTRMAETSAALSGPRGDDPFYQRTDLSLDFYRGIRRVQRDHLASRTYARAITAFGLGLLNETGSRKSRRQSDLAGDRTMSLRQIRAIPHNAVLQQLGYPVNVIAGAGTAAGDDMEDIAALIAASPRGRQIVRMIRASSDLASIKSVAAYGELFNSAYWASRPYRGTETHLQDACLALAERLTSDDRTGVYRRLASRLRVDGLKLHRLLARLPIDDADSDDRAAREDVRRSLGALHALRLALMQHMFLLAVSIPAFSRSNDISRDDVLDMVFSLRIDDALAQLRRAFPVSSPSLADFTIDEPSDYPDRAEQAYAGIQARYIDRIDRAWQLCLRIGTVIANHFGAHG